MTEHLVTTGRDTLAEAMSRYLAGGLLRRTAPLADHLIDSGVVRIVDSADPAMVERVRREISVLVPDRDGRRDRQVIAVAWEVIAAVLS